jgi:hypothetical protein
MIESNAIFSVNVYWLGVLGSLFCVVLLRTPNQYTFTPKVATAIFAETFNIRLGLSPETQSHTEGKMLPVMYYTFSHIERLITLLCEPDNCSTECGLDIRKNTVTWLPL